MVEINNQRKAFLDMLAWSEELITDVRKPEIMVMTSFVGQESYIYWLLDHPRKLVTLNPKLKSTTPDATSFFPVGGMPCRQLAWKTSLRKVRTLWHCSRLKAWRFTYMIDRGDIRRQSTVPAIWASPFRALVMVSSSIRLTAWLQNSKKRAERSEIDVWAESPRLSPLVICIIVYCLSWAINHYRDNAITYKAQRDKNARELKLANAAITDMQMRQRDVAALDAKYTGVSWC